MKSLILIKNRSYNFSQISEGETDERLYIYEKILYQLYVIGLILE